MDRTLIALALGARTTAEARRAFERNAPRADLIELRLDYMQECNLAELLRDRPCPVIVTHRPVREGGFYEGDEQARVRLLVEAAELGAEHVDIEWDSVGLLDEADLGTTKRIVSSHDFEKMPPDLEALHQRQRNLGADIAKVVGTARGSGDSVATMTLLKNAGCPTIAIGMGAHGAVTRLLAFKYGAYLSFGSLNEEGKQTAPGQFTLDSLERVYFVRHITPETSVFGYVSREMPPETPIADLNAELRDAGHNAVVFPVCIGDEPFDAAIANYRRLELAGFIIDSPLAGRAFDIADELEPAAKSRQRSDTLILREGRLIGCWGRPISSNLSSGS